MSDVMSQALYPLITGLLKEEEDLVRLKISQYLETENWGLESLRGRLVMKVHVAHPDEVVFVIDNTELCWFGGVESCMEVKAGRHMLTLNRRYKSLYP